jgi:hypothetical protein
MTLPYFRQNEAPWNKFRLYDDGPTVGSKGCTLTCVAQAVQELTDLVVNPEIALYTAQLVGALVDKNGRVPGALLNIPLLAEQFNLIAPPGERTDMAKHGERAIRECLDHAFAKGMAILWVDHDRTRAGGDEQGDHYVLGLRIEDGAIVCADPATGTDCRINLGTLEGPAPWGRRTYRVMGVRPIRRALTLA